MENIYTLDEIRELVTPVAKKHNLAAVWVFGSYARGEATKNSDVDFLVDLEGSDVKGWGYGELIEEFIGIFKMPIDVVTIAGINTPRQQPYFIRFKNKVERERKLLYAHKRYRSTG